MNPEIAQALQVKLAAIKSSVHRARLFLRRRLAAYVDPGLDAARRSENLLVHRTRAMSHRNVEVERIVEATSE
jgi:hypothetical protein